MNFKTIILVIILSILVGTGIFFGEKLVNPKSLVPSSLNSQTKQTGNLNSSPSGQNPAQNTQPQIPTFPPISPNSNLKEEAEKLTPPDFTEDIKSLRSELAP